MLYHRLTSTNEYKCKDFVKINKGSGSLLWQSPGAHTDT